MEVCSAQGDGGCILDFYVEVCRGWEDAVEAGCVGYCVSGSGMVLVPLIALGEELIDGKGGEVGVGELPDDFTDVDCASLMEEEHGCNR